MKIKWIALCLSMLMMFTACSFFGGDQAEQQDDTQTNQEDTMDETQDGDQGDEPYGPDSATEEEENKEDQQEEETKQPETTPSEGTSSGSSSGSSSSGQQTEKKKLSSSEALKVVKQNIDTSQYSAQVINNSLKVDGNEYVLILVSDSQATLEPAVAVNVYTGELKSYYPDGTIHDYQGFSSDDDNTPKG